jgi:hypothetical protein
MNVHSFCYRLNLFLTFIIFFVLVLVIFLYQSERWSHKEEFITEKNPDPKRSNVKSTTFQTFEFHAEKNGYLQIGHMLLNWGQSDKQGFFAKPFTDPHGALCTSHRNGSGINNIKVRKVKNDKIKLRAKTCERPNMFFAWGWHDIDVPRSQITVNDLSKKPVLLQNLAFEEQKQTNDHVEGGNGCAKTSTVRTWHKDF